MSGRTRDVDDVDDPRPVRAPTLWMLFTAFLKIGALGFGGVAAFARHVLVVERGFLTEQEFAELFGLCSTLPGANTVNLATLLGDRHRGLVGAMTTLLGLIGVPLLLLIAIATLYAAFSDIPAVGAGLSGAAAAAAGLVVGTSLRILKDLDADAIAILTAAIVGLAAVFRLPMVLILAVAIPVSLAIATTRQRKTIRERGNGAS